MGKWEITDEMLYQIMPALNEKMINSLPDEEQIEYEFSDEFNKKMEKLIHRVSLKEKYYIPVSRKGRVAAAASILILATMTTTLSVEAYREKFFGFIKKIYETYVIRHYEIDEYIEFIPQYPQYIPDGYELVVEDVGETYLTLSYESMEENNEAYVLINEEQITDEMSTRRNNEYIQKESININSYNGHILHTENGDIEIEWHTEDSTYIVLGYGISETELIKISESIQ